MNRFHWLWTCMVGLSGLGTVACGAPVEGGSADEPLGETENAFKNSLSFPQSPSNTACSGPQQTTIQTFATFLSDRIYENQGNSMRDCLNDTFLSHANGGEWGGDVWNEFNLNVTTQVYCTSNLTTTCANVDGWWGCANIGISGERVTFATQFVNDPSVSVAEKASLFAHELNHNYGQSDPNGSETEYFWSIQERARSCVRNFNALPAPGGVAESRTNGMPGENELGYIGRFGGTPFELTSTGSEFASGFTVRANATVNSLQVRFTDSAGTNRSSVVVGTSSGVLDTRNCNSDEVVVGISGRANGTVNRLTVRCGLRSNLASVRDLTPSGDNVGTPYSTMCPAGKAVRYVRGRAGSTIDQIRVVCDDIGKSYFPNHAPHQSGSLVGSASGKLFGLRCTGNGAFSSFDGTVSPALKRLGGMCRATGSVVPIVPSSALHPASNWLGGNGGTAFSNGCNPNELMVGVQLRAAGSINAIGPICADATGWDATSSTPTRSPALSGSTSGTLTAVQCPVFQFLVGLDAWGGANTVNGVTAVCADMR